MGSKYSKFCEVHLRVISYSLLNPSVDGRRPAFLFHLPLMVIGSLITAQAESVSQLLVGRTIQAFGASPGLSVGAGVIGDIYRLEERGTALGSYFGVSHSGPEPSLLI